MTNMTTLYYAIGEDWDVCVSDTILFVFKLIELLDLLQYYADSVNYQSYVL